MSVPYAAAPVGARRFRAPEPLAAWRDLATRTPGPTAPQSVRPFPGLDVEPLVGTGWQKGDHYLTTNIWAPDPPARGLPVMVFVHGGAFVLGSNNAAATDGSAFARSGIVCVSINYRLGIEGFLPLPGAPTNLGLRDQIAALEWVRDNIAEFGGDPDNVTLFGESAGAMSVACLLASPGAHGLFRRAIIQSGHGDMVREPDAAARLVAEVARLLDVAPSADSFATRTVEQAVAALEQVLLPTLPLDLRGGDGRDPSYGLSRFLPVLGDDLLPAHPHALLAAGAGEEVEILIGTNAEEMNLYFVPTGVRGALGADMATAILGRSHPEARAVLEAYGLGSDHPGAAFTRAMHDLVFREPARRLAASHRGRTHVYEFGWRSPACSGELGACHGLELPFVFDTLGAATGPAGLVGEAPPRELARHMHETWCAFARGEEPGWPRFDADTREVMRLDTGQCEHEPPMPAASFNGERIKA